MMRIGGRKGDDGVREKLIFSIRKMSFEIFSGRKNVAGEENFFSKLSVMTIEDSAVVFSCFKFFWECIFFGR